MKFAIYLFMIVAVATPVFACSAHGALMPDGSVVAIVGDSVPPGGVLVVRAEYYGHPGGGWYYFPQNTPVLPQAPASPQSENVDYNG